MPRYRVTHAEQEAIIAKATELLSKNPNINMSKLYKLTTQALGLHTSRQVAWFNEAIKKIKQESIKQKFIKQEPVKPEPVKQRSIAYQFIDELLEYKNTIEVTIEYIKDRLDKIDNNIASFKGLLQNILGSLDDYQIEETVEPKEPRKQLPKIAVIGPLKDQYDEISRRVGTEKVKLYYLDKERSLHENQMRGFDYIFISRHCKHSIYWDSKAAIGNEKVFRIPGGINTIADKIIEVVEKHDI